MNHQIHGVAGTTDTERNLGEDPVVERPPVSVLVVDDLASFRRAAAAVIGATDSFLVAGQADSGEAALNLLQRLPVSLVLMDVNMPGIGGIRAAAEMRRRFPDVRVVLLSIHTLEDLSSEVTRCGAQFCHKEHFGPEELDALWIASGGQSGF